jgi:hypothetical protein
MATRWLWLPGLIAGLLLLAMAHTPNTAHAQRVENLVKGCTPVAMTFDDGTAITTVGEGVQPTGILTSIWKYLPADHRWIGYSASAPAEISDLQTVDKLDPLFVCTNEAGTITMPQIGGGG